MLENLESLGDLLEPLADWLGIGTESLSNADAASKALEQLEAAGAVDFADAIASHGITAESYDQFREIGWSDADGNGLDTRQEMLIESSNIDASVGANGNIHGEWTDPYTGETTTDSSKVELDHIIPVQQLVAEHPGILQLPMEEQIAIYNDPANLQVVHESTNTSKGATSFGEFISSVEDANLRQELLAKVLPFKAFLLQTVG